MFGAKYSRKKFWLIAMLSVIFIGIPGGFANMASNANSVGSDIAIIILSFILTNSLANRIRDYGSNPWLALWALLPLVGLFQALYFGILNKKSDKSSG